MWDEPQIQTLDADGVRCHVLVDGWRTVSPRFVFRGYDDAVHGPYVRPYLDPDGRLRGRFAALLIEAPDGPVLVDAGLGRFAGDLDAGHVHGELEQLGMRPWDIHRVVITHGHADHVGGLVGPRQEPAFPDARHVVHRKEAEFWASSEAASLPDDAASAARSALAALLDAHLLDAIEDDVDVADGVRAILAPGHTPGHLAVTVNGALLWSGDAIVSQLNVSHPGWVSSADMDGPMNEATRRALLARAADEGLLLAGAHLPVVAHVAREDGSFALETA